MFKHRSEQKELMDDLTLSNEELGRNLDDIEFCNKLFGSNRALLDSLNKILDKYPTHLKNKKIIVADLGCGSGDQILIMQRWAASHQINIHIIGIDANPYMIQHANKKLHTANNIEYKVMNIFSPEFAQMQFDIITINSVCHHFNDDTLAKFFTQLAKQARLAVIFNDLQRHWLSYHGIKIIAKLLHFSYLTQADAPLSVLRAFRKKELIAILNQAQVNLYQIRWAYAFRWVIIIWCKN